MASDEEWIALLQLAVRRRVQLGRQCICGVRRRPQHLLRCAQAWQALFFKTNGEPTNLVSAGLPPPSDPIAKIEWQTVQACLKVQVTAQEQVNHVIHDDSIVSQEQLGLSNVHGDGSDQQVAQQQGMSDELRVVNVLSDISNDQFASDAEDQVQMGQRLNTLMSGRRTAASYNQLLDYPIYTTANTQRDWQPPTVGTMVLNLLSIKDVGGMNNNAFDLMVRLMADIMLPPQNFLPRSWHLIKEIAKVEQPELYEIHVCTCTQPTHWDPMPKEEWRVYGQNPPDFQPGQSVKYFCSNCGLQRFQYSQARTVEVHGYKYYDLTLIAAIKAMFQHRQLCEVFGQGTSNMPYFQSTEYIRLQAAIAALQGVDCSPDLTSIDYILLELGHDGMQPFDTNRRKTTWVVWVRIKNVAPSAYSRKYNQIPILILPKEIDLSRALDSITLELEHYQPGKEKLSFQDGTGRQLNVHLVLTGVLGDYPARSKVAKAGEHTSYFPCLWCVQEGVPVQQSQRRGGRRIQSGRGRGGHVRGQGRQHQLQQQARPVVITQSSQQERYLVAEAIEQDLSHNDVDAYSGGNEQQVHQLITTPLPQHECPQQQLVTSIAQEHPATLTGKRQLRYLGYDEPLYVKRFLMLSRQAQPQLFHKSSVSELRGESARIEQLRAQLPIQVFTKQHLYGQSFYCGDPLLKLTNLEQKLRQNLVSRHPELSKLLGCKGHDLFSDRLQYTMLQNLYILPPWHQCLRGVLRDFWDLACGPHSPFLTSQAKVLIQARADGIINTNDNSSKYKDVIEYIRSFKMQDLLSWADVHSVFVLQNVLLGLHSDANDYRVALTKCVHAMHEAVVFYCRPTAFDGDKYKEELQKHAGAMFQYAKLMEGVQNGCLCKANLHLTVCRLPQQCLDRGHCGSENETQLERGVQWLKEGVRYSVTSNVERQMAVSALFGYNLAYFQHNCAIPNIDQLMPTYRRYAVTDLDVDSLVAHEEQQNFSLEVRTLLQQWRQEEPNVYMTGKVVLEGVNNEMLLKIRALATRDLGSVMTIYVDGQRRRCRFDWNTLQACDILQWSQVQIQDQTRLTCFERSAAPITQSYWCVVKYVQRVRGHDIEGYAVARIDRFIVLARQDIAQFLNTQPRYAIITYYRTESLHLEGDSSREIYRADLTAPETEEFDGQYLLHISDIMYKVMRFNDMSTPEGRAHQVAYFAPYTRSTQVD